MLEIHVNIHGAKELNAKFGMFKAYMQAGLLPAWTKIAALLQKRIYAATPKQTGKLVRSTVPKVMPMRVQSIASAINPRDGYNYAAIQHYGGRAFYMGDRSKPIFIRPKYYMTGPLHQIAPRVPGIISDEIARIIAACGL